jgi:multiple sugar transport system ATP-binding protein
MADVVTQSLSRRFGKTLAVDQVSLTCQDGEFFILLGPSGAGKTTTLKLIAGLVEPTSGMVFIGGREVTGLEPGHRDVAMAFETYALYPHLSVYENLAFPLRSPRAAGRYTPKALDERVRAIAGLLEIDPLLDRAPTKLSGGQKQRVALGRALVREPAVFLLDEPIAHLDAKLRNRMHAELRRIQKQLGTTTIYATPDYSEAMAMADRLAVIEQGRLIQVGAPLEVYFNPANEFVARFMGDPPMNLFDCEVVSQEDRPALRLAGEVLALSEPTAQALSRIPNGRVRLGVRPADIAIVDWTESSGAPVLSSEVVVVEPSERTLVVTLRSDGMHFKLKTPADGVIRPGARAQVRFDPTRLYLFDPATGLALQQASPAADVEARHGIAAQQKRSGRNRAGGRRPNRA